MDEALVTKHTVNVSLYKGDIGNIVLAINFIRGGVLMILHQQQGELFQL